MMSCQLGAVSHTLLRKCEGSHYCELFGDSSLLTKEPTVGWVVCLVCQSKIGCYYDVCYGICIIL